MSKLPPTPTTPTSSSGSPPDQESLESLLYDVLSLEAKDQGLPPPTLEECQGFQRLIEGLPTAPG